MTPLLRTPLAATAAVIAGLLILAVPLRQLTKAQTAAPSPAAPAATHTTLVPAWLTLKLLAPAESIRLATTAGDTLLSLDHAPAGDHEARVHLPLASGHAELVLEVRRPDNTPETAAFLTIAPDGMEERSDHAIGSGTIHDLLEFHW